MAAAGINIKLAALGVFLFLAVDSGRAFQLPKIDHRNSHQRFTSSVLRVSSTSLSSQPTSSPEYQNAQGRRKAESLERGHHPLMSLNLNLDSLAQGGAAPRAQELLERIEALYQEGYYAVAPDIVSYNSVLNAWVKRNEPEKALELLRALEEKSADSINDDNNIQKIQPNVISYNTVINAFAQKGLYKTAEKLLRELQQHDRLEPDTVTYNNVLYAYAQSNEPDSALKAEALLREMMTDENNAQVDTTSFNTVLHAWAQVAKNTHAMGQRAPHRARELLDHMERLSSAGNAKVRPDVHSYTTVIEACVAQLKSQLRRNTQHRNSKSGDNHLDTKEAADTAQQLLQKMEERYIRPNRVTHTAVMMALCLDGRPQEAHDIILGLLDRFEQMLQHQSELGGDNNHDIVDTIAFSVVIGGWAQNAHNFPGAPERVLELLEIMKYWASQGHEDMRPNARTYTSVLSALAKSRTWDGCIQAQHLLHEIPDSGPTVIHCNTVLDAFAKSPRADKALHAAALLQEMTEDAEGSPQVSPDLISCNSVLSACASAFGSPELKKKTLRIAMDVFQRVVSESDKGIKPSPYTFAVMIKALRKLVSDQDAQYNLVSKVFLVCCQRGMVNEGVWRQLRTSMPHNEETSDRWEQILGKDLCRVDNVQFSDLPLEWKRHSWQQS